MGQPFPYRTGRSTLLSNGADTDLTNVINLLSVSAVIIIGRRGCCMSHVVQRLLQSLGVIPPVYEIDEHHEAAVASHLASMAGQGGNTVQFPALFVGGKLFGGLEKIVGTHVSGGLVPILKDAGALRL